MAQTLIDHGQTPRPTRPMSRFDRGLIALPGLFAEPMQLHAWLAINADSQNAPEIQTLTDLIQQTFNERHEWFQT